MWLRYTGLAITSNIRTGFIYHKSAVAHAIQEDVTTDITWHGDRAAHWINAMMAMGAGLIDEAGLVRLKSTET